METEVSIALIVAFSTLAGTGIGAFATYKIEQRRHKWELEKQKLAWKREDRLKSFKPIRDYLDKMSQLVGRAWFSESWEIRTETEHETFDSNLRDNIIRLQSDNAALHLTVSDPELVELLLKLHVDPDEASVSAPYLFDKDYREKIRAAYKRLEELSEF